MAMVKIRIENNVDIPGVGNAAAITTKPDEASKKIGAKSLFAHQMIATAKQTFNYAISNIGNFTGDYIKQDQVQNIVDSIGDLSTVGLGFASGGVVGGIVVSIGIATKKTFEVISDMRKNELSERQRAYMLERSGNATKNGSRGTEN